MQRPWHTAQAKLTAIAWLMGQQSGRRMLEAHHCNAQAKAKANASLPSFLQRRRL